MSSPTQAPARARSRKVSVGTIIILILAGVAAVTYYLGSPPAQPSAQPTIGACPLTAAIVVPEGAGVNASESYKPPQLNLVVGVNNTVTWVDQDPGFEIQIYSVAVPPDALQWDLNMTSAQGVNTQCLLLSEPGSYTYRMSPFDVVGMIVVKGAVSSAAA